MLCVVAAAVHARSIGHGRGGRGTAGHTAKGLRPAGGGHGTTVPDAERCVAFGTETATAAATAAGTEATTAASSPTAAASAPAAVGWAAAASSPTTASAAAGGSEATGTETTWTTGTAALMRMRMLGRAAAVLPASRRDAVGQTPVASMARSSSTAASSAWTAAAKGRRGRIASHPAGTTWTAWAR